MGRVVDYYFKTLKLLIAFLLAAMVVLVFTNVFLRYAFNSGITISEEVSRWFFVWLVFLGAIVGLREHAHISMNALVQRLPILWQRIFFFISRGAMLYATLLIIEGSWTQTLINLNITAPSSGWSFSFFYGVGLVFGVSSAIILVFELINELYQIFRGRQPHGV